MQFSAKGNLIHRPKRRFTEKCLMFGATMKTTQYRKVLLGSLRLNGRARQFPPQTHTFEPRLRKVQLRGRWRGHSL